MDTNESQELYSDLTDHQFELLEKLEILTDLNEIEAIKKEISVLYQLLKNVNYFLYVKDLVLLKQSDPNNHVSTCWKNYRVIGDKHISILKKHFHVEVVDNDKRSTSFNHANFPDFKGIFIGAEDL